MNSARSNSGSHGSHGNHGNSNGGGSSSHSQVRGNSVTKTQ